MSKPFHFSSPTFAAHLRPRPVLEAFAANADFLMDWKDRPIPALLPLLAESRRIKEVFFAQVAGLDEVPAADATRTMSLQALASGLLCGALDGTGLYQLGARPDQTDCPPALVEALRVLEHYAEVADGPWREMDADGLQLQAGYGKHLNLATDEENVRFLGQPGRTGQDARRAMLETFRTAYSLGLIDSAIACLHNQRPDPLSPPDEESDPTAS